MSQGGMSLVRGNGGRFVPPSVNAWAFAPCPQCREPGRIHLLAVHDVTEPAKLRGEGGGKGGGGGGPGKTALHCERVRDRVANGGGDLA